MKKIEIPASQKETESQNQLVQRLSPTWLGRQRVPAALASTALTRRLRAAVYMRYSTEHQDPYSFARQLEKAKAYAETIGADIVKVYGDPGASGAYTANRPGFSEMVEAAKKGEFDVVIIEDGDRLARKLHITTAVFNTLTEHGVELHSSKLGRWSPMHAAFSGLMSDEQRTRINELMRSGIVKILKRGLWPAQAPYGFVKIPGRPGDMRIDDEEGPVVKRMFAMRLAGMHCHDICRTLTKEKIRPPRTRWTAETVRRILVNPIYVGAVLYFKTAQKTMQVDASRIMHTRLKRPIEEWHCAERPDWAIVSLPDWQNVQQLEVRNERGPTPKFLLPRLVFCGKCGRRMRVEGRHNGRCTLRCTTAWRRYEFCEDIPPCDGGSVLLDSLEDQVIRFVCEKLDTPEAIKAMRATYDKKVNEQAENMNRERGRLDKERRAILKTLDATFDATLVAGLTTVAVRDQRANYCARIEEIDRRIAEIPHVSVTRKALLDPPLDAGFFLSELTPMRDYYDCSEGLARLSSSFRALVEKIVVSRDQGSRNVSVTVHGPISNIAGGSFTYEQETRAGRHIEIANKLMRKDVLRLTDEDWSKIAPRLPLDAIWIEEFDQPVDLRSVLDAIIFVKHAKVGIGHFADRFGPRRLVWAAARMLDYAGALDLIEDLMRSEGVRLIEGISLSLEAARAKCTDPWKRILDWNERWRLSVQARLAKQREQQQSS